MKRRVLTVALAILLVPVVLLGLLVLVAQSEWGERKLEAVAGRALDRIVEIDGISFKWGWPPGVQFAKLRISNPNWAQTPSLVDAEGLYARVRVAPLFAGKVVIPYLGARRASAGLEVDGERTTWKFGPAKPPDQADQSRLYLMRVYLDDGDIRFIDAPNASDLAIDVKGSAGAGGKLTAQAKGTFRGEKLTARATVPELATQHEAPVRFEGEAAVGRTKASAEGSLATDGSALDLALKLAGPTMKELAKVTQVVLPDSPPYQLAGRLRHQGNDWTFEKFEGKVGDSDIAGDLTYTKEAKKRPFLRAKLHAKLLDFDDLGPLVGSPPKTGAGETAAPEQKAKAAQRVATSRLLPDEPFGTDAWGKMDADVTLEARNVQRPKQLPIESLSTHLLLRDSVLTLQPLDFGMAGGHVTSSVKLDARQKPMRGEITADVKSLQLGRLFPTSQAMQQALGTFYGRAELKGAGQSVAALLGSSNGKASFVVEGGRVSQLLTELIELDVAQLVMLLGRKQQQEELRCAVSGFDIRNGVATTDSFVIDSQETVIRVEGELNLKDETMALKSVPQAKHPSLVSLRTPINLQGPLRKPKVRPEAGPLVRKGALAVGLGAINPALAVFALYEPKRGEDQPCAQLIGEAKAKGAGKAKEANDNPQRAAEKADRRAPVAVSGNDKGAPGEEVAEKKKGG